MRGPSARECQVRDVATLKQIILPRAGEMLREARFSPDGQLVVAASAESRSNNVPTKGTSRRASPPPGSWVGPDGRIWSFASGPVARFYQSGDGAPLAATLNHEAPIDRIAFAPDGTAVITSGGELIRIWQVPSGQPLASTLHGQSFAEFSADGRLILTLSKLGALMSGGAHQSEGMWSPRRPPCQRRLGRA